MRLITAAFTGGLCFFLALISGCATAPQSRELLDPSATPIQPRQIELTTVPFHPQERYQCGPAALATVLNWTNIGIDPESLVPEVYVPARQGSFQLELLASTRRHGRLAYVIEPRLDSLLREVANGTPVLVLQNLGLSWAPTWHFAVVVGYDLGQGLLVLRSGITARHLTPLATFEHTWARGGYWGMVALQPGQLPAQATPGKYLQAVVMLEQAQQWSAANTSYMTALRQWPGNLTAQIGLGNSAYRLGDKFTAAAAFRAAVDDHPDSGIAHNNLAQLLLEFGDLAAAEQHARIAVSLGGAQQAVFEKTLEDILRQPAR